LALEVQGLLVLEPLELWEKNLFLTPQLLVHLRDVLLLLVEAVVLAVQVNLQRVALVVVALMVLPPRQLVLLVHLVKEMLAAKDLTLPALTAVVGVARELLV
jgi:hypothetical protein